MVKKKIKMHSLSHFQNVNERHRAILSFYIARMGLVIITRVEMNNNLCWKWKVEIGTWYTTSNKCHRVTEEKHLSLPQNVTCKHTIWPSYYSQVKHKWMKTYVSTKTLHRNTHANLFIRKEKWKHTKYTPEWIGIQKCYIHMWNIN